MARPSIICKTPADLRVSPHWNDYEGVRAGFSWDRIQRQLAGLPGGGVNIAWEALDRHLAGAGGDRVAFRFLGDGHEQAITYRQLTALANRYANVLAQLGVGRGERVFMLAGRIPALYFSVLGSLKNGSVACPLFSAFGPEPIATRLNLGDARVLVTTASLYRRKVEKIRDRLPGLRHVLLVQDQDLSCDGIPATLDLERLMAQASDQFDTVATQAEDMALLHFTSGTTGAPKGAVHVHGAAATHWATGKYALDLHADDIYWCTADPGWVTGTSYGIIAPLLHGVTSVIDQAEFDAERWYRILAEQQVSVWYTAPTAIRMLMKAGPALASKYAFPRLRFIASVGEPLNPEAVWWGKEVLGLAIHDNWWQTETGGIMIANTPAFDIKPGSMGRPLPGIDACIVTRDEQGQLTLASAPDTEGELALKRGWPSMFRGYLNNEERYRKCFSGDLYLTGDIARRDRDGYFWFIGRSDDVIKSAGHLIGPFEVESALMEHPAVAEAGVIGKPDETLGEMVKAFVSLKAGFEPGDSLRMELLGHARKRLGAAVAPKEIGFLASLPRTRSGKIMRRLLKARELGLPEGDTSTLEGRHEAPGRLAAPRAAAMSVPYDKATCLSLLTDMLRIRRLEEKSAELYGAGKIRGFLHLYIGEEAVAVGALHALCAQDNIVATYREHGHALVRGVPMNAIMAEMFGKRDGCSHGRGGSMHIFDRATRFYGGNAIVGGGLPLAVGLALAASMQGEPRVSACFFGEGAIAEGAFHESMNLAALWRLPVLFLCENNFYAMGTALARSESQTDLCVKAASYAMPAARADGMDVVAVHEAVHAAVEHVRAGKGPHFVELQTYRFRAHSMFDPELYRDKAEVEEWKKRGPIHTFSARLKDEGKLTEGEFLEIDARIDQEVQAAVAFAEASEWESVEMLTRDVCASGARR